MAIKSFDDGLLVGVGCGLVGLRLVVWGLVGRGCLVLGGSEVLDLRLDEADFVGFVLDDDALVGLVL